MTLEAAAQLLTTALMLLQTVSTNPSLPQSVRDGAQGIAQSAITEATRTIGTAGQGGSPSCKITSDKYNYRLGEIIVFSWESQNAASLSFVQDSEKTGLDAPAIDLSMGGTWNAVAKTSGYPFVTMQVKDTAGRSATCSAMVSVQ